MAVGWKPLDGAWNGYRKRRAQAAYDLTAQRAENVYTRTIPDLLAENADVYSAVRRLHASALQGWSLSDLEDITKDHTLRRLQRLPEAQPGHFRSQQITGPTKYHMTALGHTTTRDEGSPKLTMRYPSEQHIDVMMRSVSQRFDAMQPHVRTKEDAQRLAAWTSLITWLIHPFYAGNKRTTRPLFTFCLQKLGQEPRYLENKEANQRTFHDAAFQLMIDLYRSDLDVLPPGIRQMQDPISDQTLVGFPPGAFVPDVGQYLADKQTSLDRVLTDHLATVDLPALRGLIDIGPASFLRQAGSAPALPGVEHYFPETPLALRAFGIGIEPDSLA